MTRESLQNNLLNLLYSQRMSSGWPFLSLHQFTKYTQNPWELLPGVAENLPGKPALHILILDIWEILLKALKTLSSKLFNCSLAPRGKYLHQFKREKRDTIIKEEEHRNISYFLHRVISCVPRSEAYQCMFLTM